ncbi:CatB-related O-acetyltransferase [Brenneria populi]|uniref:CatB-related O-acetyltransferase n=1 Tax=Brenneria populi TaxID=1505588 RepID=A0ABU6JVN2_9GAMM|nr:CatB-related O-acetyltransferase [Brenneria populi Li et al. 2015]
MDYPLSFRWTARHEEFCVAENIFLEHTLKIKGVYKQWKPWWFKKGKTFTVTCDIFAENFATMPRRGFCSVGAYSYADCWLPNEMRIGRYCSIAQGVTFMGTQHPTDRFTTNPITYHDDFARLSGMRHRECFNQNLPLPSIGHDVWIGGNVVLKGGITIGNGAVIGANAVVTKDVPPYAIVAGVPARIIRFRFDENVIHQLLDLNWWDYKPADLPTDANHDIHVFIDRLEEKIKHGDIITHPYKKINLSKVFKELD